MAETMIVALMVKLWLTERAIRWRAPTEAARFPRPDRQLRRAPRLGTPPGRVRRSVGGAR
jgi:hypothetical protein